MPLTFGTFDFESQLTTRQPELFLAPLRHDLSNDAPGGAVEGVVSVASEEGSAAIERVPKESPAPLSVPSSESLQQIPAVEITSVTPSLRTAEVELPLRRFSASGGDPPRPGAEEEPASPAEESPEDAAEAPGVSAPVLSQLISEGETQRQAPNDDGDTPRRLGLGPPISHEPPAPQTPSVQPDAPSMDLVQRVQAEPTPEEPTGEPDEKPAVGVLGERPLVEQGEPRADEPSPEPTEARSPAPEAPALQFPTPTVEAPFAEPPVPQLPTTPTTKGSPQPARAARPLPFARPLAPSVQRSVEDVPSSLRSDIEHHTGVDLGGSRIIRGEPTDRVATRINARAFASEGDVHLPAARGPSDSENAKPLIAHELVHVAQQRKLGPPKGEDSPLGRKLESEARRVEMSLARQSSSVSPRVGSVAPEVPASAPGQSFPDIGQAAVAAGLATREADGSVVFNVPEAAEPVSPASSTPSQAAPQVQRAAEEATAGGSSQDKEAELEKMATSLYDRIRERLRRDLWLQREKYGLHNNGLG